jgi:hypothetical protein
MKDINEVLMPRKNLDEMGGWRAGFLGFII